MELKQRWYNAIDIRTSRRAYKHQTMNSFKANQIKDLIRVVNAESGLHIRFVEDGNPYLSGLKASYGLFSGSPSLIAMVGEANQPDLKRLTGYYGELILLECISIGLGTCWIGGSYDREQCSKSIKLKNSETLVCTIAAGETAAFKTLKESLISQIGRKKQSFEELLADTDETPPLWVKLGIEAARTAPSAVNGKPIAYRFQNNEVSAFIAKRHYGSEEIDLGISMAHFQLGAMQGLHYGSWLKDGDQYVFR